MSEACTSRALLFSLVVLLQCCAPAFSAPEVEWVTGWGTEHEDHVFEGVACRRWGFLCGRKMWWARFDQRQTDS